MSPSAYQKKSFPATYKCLYCCDRLDVRRTCKSGASLVRQGFTGNTVLKSPPTLLIRRGELDLSGVRECFTAACKPNKMHQCEIRRGKKRVFFKYQLLTVLQSLFSSKADLYCLVETWLTEHCTAVDVPGYSCHSV